MPTTKKRSEKTKRYKGKRRTMFRGGHRSYKKVVDHALCKKHRKCSHWFLQGKTRIRMR